MDKFLVFSGNSNRELTSDVCRYLNIPLADSIVQRFPDGEIDVRVNEDARGADAFVIQSTCPPVNENLMELLIMIDCLKRASAGRITAVIPYFGYARQDRKTEARVPITAKLVANLLTASGANRILTLDLHAAQIQGFFDIPVDHLSAFPVVINYIKSLMIPELMLIAPDIGAIKMARIYAKRLDSEIAVIDKRRTGATQTQVMNVIGEIRGKNVIIIDDIISTGTSIAQAAKVCKEHGAKDIYLYVTHPVFAKGCADKLSEIDTKEIIVTDSIPVSEETKSKLLNLKILSVANLLGEAIHRIHKSESVSALFT